MRLLLTSNGLANNAIKEALRELVQEMGREFKNSSVVFIPTGAIPESGDKGWLINDLKNFYSLGFASVDIVELAALSPDRAKTRLESAEIIVFGGGDTYYLRKQVEQCAPDSYWQELFQDRIYVGISAGSILACPHLGISSESSIWIDPLKQANKKENELDPGRHDEDPWKTGFGFVDFYFRPHLNSANFPCSQPAALNAIAPLFQKAIYAFDDNSAIVINNKQSRFVGTGKTITYEKSDD